MKLKTVLYPVLVLLPLGIPIMIVIEMVMHRKVLYKNIKERNFKLKIWE